MFRGPRNALGSPVPHETRNLREEPATHPFTPAMFPTPPPTPGYSKHDLSSTANTRLGTPVYMAPEVGALTCLGSWPVQVCLAQTCCHVTGGSSPCNRPAMGGHVLNPTLPMARLFYRRSSFNSKCNQLRQPVATSIQTDFSVGCMHSPPQVIFINSKYDAKKADVWSCGKGPASGVCCIAAAGPAAGGSDGAVHLCSMCACGGRCVRLETELT